MSKQESLSLFDKWEADQEVVEVVPSNAKQKPDNKEIMKRLMEEIKRRNEIREEENVKKIVDKVVSAIRVKTDEMKIQDWINAWNEDPHFGKSKTPSPLVKEFYNLLGNGKNVLEIGCGNGRDSIYLSSKKCSVTAIDVVPEAIRIARSNDIDGAVKFEVGNAENLSYQDNSFDGVYSLSVLHSTDMEKSIAEVSRVLRSKGVFLTYLYQKTTFPKPLGGETVEINFDQKELEVLFKKNSFVQKDSWRFEVDDKDHVHSVIVYSMVKK